MRRKLQLKQIDLHLDDQAQKISLSIQNLMQGSDKIGEKLVLDDTVLRGELTSIANSLSAIQADVDQNEVDSDAAEATLTADLSAEVTARVSGDAALQALITSNDQDIANLTAELDDTQAGAGLAADGSYTAVGSRDYIGSASSLDDADAKLSVAVKANEDAIAQEVSDRVAAINSALASEMSFRGEVDASASNPLSSFGTIAKGDMWVVTTAGTQFDESLEAGDMIIAKQAGAALGQSPFEFAYVQKNFDLSAYATVTALAAVQADVDANEIAANNAISQLQADVDGNEADADAMDNAIKTGAGLEANGAFAAPVGATFIGTASSLKDMGVKLDTAATTNQTNINTLVSSLETAAGFDFCHYYTMDEAQLNTISAGTNPQIRFQNNPQVACLKGGFTVDYDALAPSGMAVETIKSKVLVTLNGLQLRGKTGSVDNLHEYGITFNANGGVNELAIEFAEGLLDGDDVICVMLARGL